MHWGYSISHKKLSLAYFFIRAIYMAGKHFLLFDSHPWPPHLMDLVSPRLVRAVEAGICEKLIFTIRPFYDQECSQGSHSCKLSILPWS